MKYIQKIIICIALCLFFNNTFSQNNANDLREESVRYYNKGDIKNAIKYAEDALMLAKKQYGNRSFLYAFIRNQLNFIYIMSGRLNKAKIGCIENNKLLTQLIKKNKKQYYGLYKNSVNILTNYYNSVGGYYHEIDSLLELTLKFHTKNSRNYTITINNLAEHNRKYGKYHKAEPLFLKSIELYEKNKVKNTEYATMINNLGLLYYEIGRYNKAEYYYKTSLEILKNTKHSYNTKKVYSNVSNNLVYIYNKQRKFDKALLMLFKNTQITDKNSIEYLHIINNVAQTYLLNGDYNLAKIFFERVVDLCKKRKHTKSQIYISSLLNIANIYNHNNNFEKAEIFNKKGMLLIEQNKGINNDLNFNVFNNLADLYYKKKDYKKANDYFLKASNSINQQTKYNFRILSEKEKFSYIKKTNFYINTYQNFAFDYHKKTPKITGDVFNNLLFHKKLILFNTRSLQQLINNSKDSALQNNYYKLYNTKQKISNNFIQTINKQLYVEVENLEKKILQRLNILYPNKKNSSKATNYKDLQNTLINDEAIIEFTNFTRYFKGKWTDTLYYCALVLRKNYKYPKLVFLSTERSLKKILKRKPYEQKDARYITNLYNNDSKAEGRGAKLYDLIWSKIDTLLPNIKRVYISPTALLYNISFSALAINNTSCLKDKYEINYLTSSQNAINKTLYFKEINSASLFGGIIYNADSLALLSAIKNYKENNLQTVRSTFDNEKNKISLKYLPSTLKEIENIKKLFTKHNKKADIFAGVNANEEAFNNTMFTQPDLLHIGTHGYYLSQEKANHRNMFIPLHNLHTIDKSLFRSGLFLAGSQRTIDGKTALENCGDGILNSYEISMHQLNKTRLVVLSACQTGLGDVAGSEGIIGLRRAFKTAGVDYMILALWEVPSYTTMEFMNLFYKYFTEGEKIETAFSKAQNKMYKTYKLPYYWAGFVLLK